MPHYRFVSTWKLQAPLEAVWEELLHAERWTSWWRGARAVEVIEPGDADGIGRLRRCTWRSRLPYDLVTEIRTTRIEPLVRIEAVLCGELEGVGTWTFSTEGDVTVARFEETVGTTKRWMNLLAPFARPFFRWNHHVLMRWGAEGLAKRLGVRLVEASDDP